MSGVDIFKELPIRLIGFSFGLAPGGVYRFSTQKVDLFNSIGYFFVGCHVVYTGITQRGFYPVLNTLCFEGICSCIVPPLINHHLCRFAAEAFWEKEEVPVRLKKWIPFIAGFLPIPFLIMFFDPFVSYLLDMLFGVEGFVTE